MGINTSAGINPWGRDVLKLQLVYGEGIGNYLNDGGVDIAPDSANIEDANTKVVALLGISARMSMAIRVLITVSGFPSK